MTAIEDILYLKEQGRLVLDMNTRAIVELYDRLDDLEKTLKLVKQRFDLEADTDETVHIPEGK